MKKATKAKAVSSTKSGKSVKPARKPAAKKVAKVKKKIAVKGIVRRLVKKDTAPDLPPPQPLVSSSTESQRDPFETPGGAQPWSRYPAPVMTPQQTPWGIVGPFCQVLIPFNDEIITDVTYMTEEKVVDAESGEVHSRKVPIVKKERRFIRTLPCWVRVSVGNERHGFGYVVSFDKHLLKVWGSQLHIWTPLKFTGGSATAPAKMEAMCVEAPQPKSAQEELKQWCYKHMIPVPPTLAYSPASSKAARQPARQPTPMPRASASAS